MYREEEFLRDQCVWKELMQPPSCTSFLFLPFFCVVRWRLPSPEVITLNLFTELASCTTLKTSGWIKHTLVISQGLEPCQHHINYYRSSICDCPSVALTTYWMHSCFPESSTHTSSKTHTHTSANVLPLPSKLLHLQEVQNFQSSWRSFPRF